MLVEQRSSLQYWLNQFGFRYQSQGFPWGMQQAISDQERDSIRLAIPNEAMDTLNKMSNQQEEARKVLLLSLHFVLLSKYVEEEKLVVMFNDAGQVYPIIMELVENPTLKEIILAVRGRYLKSKEHPLSDISALQHKIRTVYDNQTPEDLFAYVVSYGSTPEIAFFKGANLHINIAISQDSQYIEIEFDRNKPHLDRFSRIVISNLIHLVSEIEENLSLPLSEIDIRSIEDREWEKELAGVKQNPQLIHKVIANYAKEQPNKVALIQGADSLTYRELNKQSNLLATLLIQHGVQRGDTVAVQCTRSLGMFVALQAVLKSGAAYMPIDPDYPDHRKQYMVEDSGCSFLISDEPSTLLKNSLNISSLDLDFGANELPEIDQNPEDEAYLLYTSGTTGKPKGVYINHACVTNLLLTQDQFDFGTDTVWSFFHSYCFDVSVWEMYGALLYGGTLIVHTKEETRDPDQLIQTIAREKVQVLCQTPTAFYNLISNNSELQIHRPHFRYVIFAGEALNPQMLLDWKKEFPDCRLINMYGITETTIYSTFKEIEEDELSSSVSNIGKSLANTSIKILNEDFAELPVGVSGEIFIAGTSISKGYLNRAELTEERFLTLPIFEGYERVYRSGDIGRRLPNGEIEYLGRKDNQVKINGFRVELEEVESHLLNTRVISDAVVVMRSVGGSEALCAYYEADSTVSSEELKTLLAEDLPDYMIPSFFLQMDRLPITTNGKKDKNNLPDILKARQVNQKQVEPETEAEFALIDACKKVFGIQSISLADEFFSFGGDSIKAIQIKSFLAQHGYVIGIKEILKGRQLGTIAAAIKKEVRKKVDQGLVTGEYLLNPAQRGFLAGKPDNIHHYNQSILLELNEGISFDQVKRALEILVKHHDTLRLVLNEKQQAYLLENVEDFVEKNILSTTTEAGIQETIVRLQRKVSLADHLFLGAFIKVPNRTLLTLAVHHFAIDGVSWRIILEDLARLLQADDISETLMPSKTNSVMEWSQVLHATDYFERERKYWEKVVQRTEEPRLALERPLPASDFDTQVFELGNSVQDLLKLNTKYNTTLEDIILSSVGFAFQQLWSAKELMITLEGHGRNEGFHELDTSRTVGWFTSLFPCRFPLSDDAESNLIEIKDTLRRVANGGVGYGVLKHIKGVEGLEYAPDLEFNYLGDFREMNDSQLPFSIADHAPGELRSPDFPFHVPLIISAFIDPLGALKLEIVHHKATIGQPAAEVARLAEQYLNELLEVAGHSPKAIHTSGDFFYKEIPQSILQAWSGKHHIEEIYPLTSVQEGILFHQQTSGERIVYHEQVSYDYSGAICSETLKLSLDKLSKRHEILRAVFKHEGLDKPVMLILEELPIQITERDISGLAAEDQVKVFKDTKKSELEGSFDFDQGALIKLYVFKKGEKQYQFIWSFHHLIMDGWCLDIINKELFSVYFVLSQGRTIDAEAASYSEFVKWLSERDEQDAATYWQQRMDGYEVGSGIPALRRGKEPAAPHQEIHRTLSVEDHRKLRKICSSHQLSVNALIQAAWALVLRKYRDKDDVIYGLVVSGRPAEVSGIETMIGNFISTLPQRLRIEESTVLELGQSIQTHQLESADYQHYSLTKIAKQLGQHGELFDHIINYLNYPLSDDLEVLTGGEDLLEAISNIRAVEQSHYDFSITIHEKAEIAITFEYNPNLHTELVMKNLMDSFLYVLDQIMKSTFEINAIQVLTAKQRDLLQHEFGPGVGGDYVLEQSIPEQVEAQAKKTPDAVALIHEGLQLTYQEVDQRANNLARQLIEKGIGENSFVPVMMSRGFDFVVSFLAINKAGGCIVPLSIYWPKARLEGVLEEIKPSVILMNKQGADQTRLEDLTESWIINQDEIEPRTDNPGPPIVLDTPMVMFHTSGSTGKPKGVIIPHIGMLNRVLSLNEYFGEEAAQCVMRGTKHVFDSIVWQLFWPLMKGGKTVIPSEKTVFNAEYFTQLVQDYQLTTSYFTPALFNEIVREISEAPVKPDYSSLREIMVGSDVISVNAVNQFRSFYPHIRLTNSYGPTEASIGCIDFPITGESYDSIPIGRPIANMYIYLLDRHGELAPVGVPAEIYIGGIGVGQGYFNLPEQTTERFIANPFGTSERMYRTGDLARWLPDGNIDYLGRIDDQIKLRGYRIELPEINHQLSLHPQIKEATVIAREHQNGKYLVAYYAADEVLEIAEIKQFLGAALPEYMVPTRYVWMDKLPLNPTGKVDRAKLPLPETQVGSDYVAPATPTETLLAQVWSDVLDMPQGTVSVEDNFFDLGSSSIDMMVISGKLAPHFEVENLLMKMFRYTNIRELSSYLDTLQEPTEEEQSEVEKTVSVADVKERRKRKRARRNSQ